MKALFVKLPRARAMLAVFFFGFFNFAFASPPEETELHRQSLSTGDRAAFPLETRISVTEDAQSNARAKVTLVFSDSGHVVTDWGEIVQDGNRFSVDVKAGRTGADIVLPVLTPISNVYDLGRLDAGEYAFAVTSRNRLLGETKFRISEAGTPPFPATASLRVQIANRGVTAVAAIRFREGGWVVRDWGEPMRRGNDWTIPVTAARESEVGPDPSRDLRFLEVRHKYFLGMIDPGEHRLELIVNGHPLAKEHFAVPDWQTPQARLHVDPLTETTSAHPMTLVLKHPAGIDPESLGDDNLRITGPNHYDRMARFTGSRIATDGTTVANYEAPAPGRLWTAADNGHYRVSLEPRSIRGSDGANFPGQTLGGFAVEIAPGHDYPMPDFHSFELSPSGNSASYRGTLTVTLPSSTVSVSDWGTAEREGRHVRIDVKAVANQEIGLPIIRKESHDYDLGALAPGVYTFSLYSRGNYIGGSRFAIGGGHLPAARVVAKPITEAGHDPHLFQVFYTSPHGMDLTSVRETALRVTGPGEFSQRAKLLEIEEYRRPETKAEVIAAVYAVPPPAHGWSAWTNGFYTISAPHESIRDNAGNYLPGGRIGGFSVTIRPGTPEGPRVEIVVDRDDDGSYFADVVFDPNGTGWQIANWGDLRLKAHTFVAPVEIRETAHDLLPQHHRYRLGRLPDGPYAFVLLGSNGFVARKAFGVGTDSVPPFEQWRSAAAELLKNRGQSPDAVSDALGLREYAFGLDPLRQEPNPVRIFRKNDGNGPALSVSYPKVPSATDVAYRVEASDDLKEWTDVTDTVFARQTTIGADGLQHETIDWPEETPHRFIRVRAERR